MIAIKYYRGYTQAMKTAISIPDPLFKHAEKLSQRLKMSRSKLYAAALAEFLARHRDDIVADKLNAVYGTEPAALDHLLADAQRRPLQNDPW